VAPALSRATLPRVFVLVRARGLDGGGADRRANRVDIASRALSPAINDPTTAVLALDQLHRLLRHVGEKQLAVGRVLDGRGRLRLAYPTRQWEDFVGLAVSEIRL